MVQNIGQAAALSTPLDAWDSENDVQDLGHLHGEGDGFELTSLTSTSSLRGRVKG